MINVHGNPNWKEVCKVMEGTSSQYKDYDSGYNAAYDIAYNRGYNAGHDEGYKAGYEAGYNDGYDQAYDASYDRGYNTSYGAGFDRGYREGYLVGVAQRGIASAEEAVAVMLPENRILPQYTVDALISMSLDLVRDDLVPLLSAQEVAERISRAIGENEGLSVVRLGDGESLVLAQETVLDSATIQERGPWLHRAGVEVPNLDARDRLRDAIVRSDIVGVPTPRLENHQPLLFRAFEKLGVDWRCLTLTHAVINYLLHAEGHLQTGLKGRRVLLVGNQARALQNVLQATGVLLTGAIGPVKGVRDVDRIMTLVGDQKFDVALVSAGVAAVIIVQQIATEMHKVALDFGHLSDELVHGHKQW